VRVALDTNVLVYAEGLGDEPRCRGAAALLDDLRTDDVVLPVQVLGELSRVLVAKTKRTAQEIRTSILDWADSFFIADSTWTAFLSALDLTLDHRMQTWDALILAVAAENRCRRLYSEDFQDGFTWRGVTVVNPFSQPRV
jgi:predicted nucleic acid-binding protein